MRSRQWHAPYAMTPTACEISSPLKSDNLFRHDEQIELFVPIEIHRFHFVLIICETLTVFKVIMFLLENQHEKRFSSNLYEISEVVSIVGVRKVSYAVKTLDQAAPNVEIQIACKTSRMAGPRHCRACFQRSKYSCMYVDDERINHIQNLR